MSAFAFWIVLLAVLTGLCMLMSHLFDRQERRAAWELARIVYGLHGAVVRGEDGRWMPVDGRRLIRR